MKKTIMYFSSLVILLLAGLCMLNSCKKDSGSNKSNEVVVDDPTMFQYGDNPTGYTIIKYIGERGDGYSYSKKINVIIPSTYQNRPVTAIADGAFSSSRLAKVTIPNSVTNIGTAENGNYISGAFESCDFTSIVLPPNLKVIGDYAFATCPLTAIDIPASVTDIGSSAFTTTKLTTVVIPNGVVNVGFDAFSYCSSLTTVTLPSGMTIIGNRLFSDCQSLTTVNLPSTITEINNYAFQNCSSLRTITLGSALRTIGGNAFDGCTSMQTMRIEATVPPTLGRDALKNTPAVLVISVPLASLSTYRNAAGWNTYATKIIGY